MRRPGRFDREVSITVPNAEQRAAILVSACTIIDSINQPLTNPNGNSQRYHTKKMPLGPCCDLDAIAAQTVAYVGADLAAVTRTAAMHALRRHATQSRLRRQKGRTATFSSYRFLFTRQRKEGGCHYRRRFPGGHCSNRSFHTSRWDRKCGHAHALGRHWRAFEH